MAEESSLMFCLFLMLLFRLGKFLFDKEVIVFVFEFVFETGKKSVLLLTLVLSKLESNKGKSSKEDEMLLLASNETGVMFWRLFKLKLLKL